MNPAQREDRTLLPWILAAGALVALGEFSLAWLFGGRADRGLTRALTAGLALSSAGASLLRAAIGSHVESGHSSSPRNPEPP